LSAGPSLAHLTLRLNPLGGTSAGTVTALLDAVKTLPALVRLSFVLSRFQDAAATGHAFAAFLSANHMPSLRILSVAFCNLGDEGLAPLLDGLAANTHLHELHCERNRASEAFERDRVAPAMAALELARARLAA
jgi:hypothetical protein